MDPKTFGHGGDERHLEALRAQVHTLRSELKTAKVASRARPGSLVKRPSYDELQAMARRYIEASYAYQKARYGSIKLRMSIAKLLR